MNATELLAQVGKPPLFAKSTAAFWDDPHISKQMLAAHLNPDTDAASRRPATIDATVAWLERNFTGGPARILDLGCGPGLYAERLAKHGHSVTGVDLSRRSVDYAESSAKQQGLEIDYRCLNYLELNCDETYDLAVMIYCDFGALSNEERDLLLAKVHRALRPGGVFVFDVFTERLAEQKKTGRDWSVAKEGFWAADEHLVLSEVFHYPEASTFLAQYVVMSLASQRFEVYRIYDHYYDERGIRAAIGASAFRDCELHRDAQAENNFVAADVMFVAARK